MSHEAQERPEAVRQQPEAAQTLNSERRLSLSWLACSAHRRSQQRSARNGCQSPAGAPPGKRIFVTCETQRDAQALPGDARARVVFAAPTRRVSPKAEPQPTFETCRRLQRSGQMITTDLSSDSFTREETAACAQLTRTSVHRLESDVYINPNRGSRLQRQGGLKTSAHIRGLTNVEVFYPADCGLRAQRGSTEASHLQATAARLPSSHQHAPESVLTLAPQAT